MTEPALDVVAAMVATMLVGLVPGAALLGAMRAGRSIPSLLVPAAAVTASVLVVAPLVVLTLWMHWSIRGLALSLGITTVLLVVAALLRWRPHRGEHTPWWRRWREALAYLPPAIVVFVLAILDAPQVRSDTYWHVALARKLSELPSLSSETIAFEAGSPGNANYPLPVWHAVTAIADQLPRVDLWFASWFMTPWLGVVAMLAFGAMAATLVGDRRASLAGCWTFAAIVLLGYGPWYFATRYLSYPGQVAIFVVLPLVVVATVAAIRTDGARRTAGLAVAAAGTVTIGMLHGNYVLYPALFAGGGAALLLLGRRERIVPALVATATVVGAGALTLGAQLPWITNDDNFLRGDAAPAGEPSAFIRHRDVFVGSESSFHVELGSLATQPWLVLGALAIPVLLLLARRRPGPWVLAGGAVAIAVFARVPQLLELLDRLGSVTPATRFDRVWPAAVGVTAIALGIGWLLERAFERDRDTGIVATLGAVVALAGATWWMDSIRDTRRIVVTPFVEARWVGGLDPSHLPRWAVIASVVAIVGVAGWIRLQHRIRRLDLDEEAGRRRLRHTLAALAVAAISIGLGPATIDRVDAAFEPQAFDRSARSDGDFVRIEVYPARVRRLLDAIEPESVVLAPLSDNRRIASLIPVQSVDEGTLRQLDALEDPDEAAVRDVLGELDDVDYVVVPITNDARFAAFEAVFGSCSFESAGNLRIYLRSGRRC